MTIKQQGGIFGRNPTFNDVSVEGSLTVDGSAIPSVDNIAVLDTAQTFTEKQTLSKAGQTFDIFNFEYTGAGDRITMGLDGYNSIMKLFSSNGSQSIQLSAGGSNNSFFKGVDVEIHNANLVMATAGQGIDFSATSGTGTSELFDDYEEGTWTPTVTSTSGTITTLDNVEGFYTKIGRQVTVQAHATTTNNGTGAGVLRFSGLPYTPVSTSMSATGFMGVGYNSSSGKLLRGRITGGNTRIDVTNDDGTYPTANGRSNSIQVTYYV